MNDIEQILKFVHEDINRITINHFERFKVSLEYLQLGDFDLDISLVGTLKCILRII